MMCLAKALGGGLPLGAFLGRREIMQTLSQNPPLAHVTTFGGHPLSCAAGLAALEVLFEEKMLERSAANGEHFLLQLRRELRGHEAVKEIRGLGSFFAIEFYEEHATQRFVQNCRAAGLIIGWTLHRTTVVRAAPPLCMRAEEVQNAVAIMVAAAQAVIST